MEDFVNHYSGKLYKKETIEKWELPQGVREQIGLDEFDFFFLKSTKEKEHGLKHGHFSIYPSKYETVHLLEVKTPSILPQLLHDTLKVLKQNGCDVITSTGFCTHKDLCHFGVFYSWACDQDVEKIISEVKKIESVQDVKIFSFTCEGCCEA